MEHVVFYPSAEGAPSFRRVSSREEAVNFVEHLRNVENVSEFSVHALTPVPLAVRAYYRIEASATEAPAAEAPVAEAPAPVQAQLPQQTVPPVDDDRAAEWVAAATVVEPPAPAAPVAPAAPEPVVAVAEPAVPVAAVAPVAPAPFAEAPPVSSPAGPPVSQEAAPVASADVLPEVDETAAAPAGRRSMGFFTR
jgi:hypothetical protein